MCNIYVYYTRHERLSKLSVLLMFEELDLAQTFEGLGAGFVRAA